MSIQELHSACACLCWILVQASCMRQLRMAPWLQRKIKSMVAMKWLGRQQSRTGPEVKQPVQESGLQCSSDLVLTVPVIPRATGLVLGSDWYVWHV